MQMQAHGLLLPKVAPVLLNCGRCGVVEKIGDGVVEVVVVVVVVVVVELVVVDCAVLDVGFVGLYWG
jgi:hypothetical protein